MCIRDRESALGHFRRTVDADLRVGARPFAALARLGWALCLADLGRSPDLVTDLAGAALAEFRLLDMPGPARRAQRLVDRPGTTRPIDSALTGRETEVAALVAQGLTPRRYWQTTSPRVAVHEMIFGVWFGPGDTIEELRSVACGQVADRERVTYRLGVRRDGIGYVVEQTAYFNFDGDRIDWIRILCSGYRPESPVA